jgi:hypothetical protein
MIKEALRPSLETAPSRTAQFWAVVDNRSLLVSLDRQTRLRVVTYLWDLKRESSTALMQRA